MVPDEPTTPDLEETYRRGVEAPNRRDFDAWVAGFSPNAVLDVSTTGLGIFEGREAIRAFFEDWIGAYEDYAAQLEEYRDLGNGVTFAVLHQRGRPTDSSGFVELRYASVSAWAEGLIERQIYYSDVDEARAAAERLAEERG